MSDAQPPQACVKMVVLWEADADKHNFAGEIIAGVSTISLIYRYHQDAGQNRKWLAPPGCPSMSPMNCRKAAMAEWPGYGSSFNARLLNLIDCKVAHGVAADVKPLLVL